MSGDDVGPTTFSQVVPGVTTEEWVLAAFVQVRDGVVVKPWRD